MLRREIHVLSSMTRLELYCVVSLTANIWIAVVIAGREAIFVRYKFKKTMKRKNDCSTYRYS